MESVIDRLGSTLNTFIEKSRRPDYSTFFSLHASQSEFDDGSSSKEEDRRHIKRQKHKSSRNAECEHEYEPEHRNKDLERLAPNNNNPGTEQVPVVEEHPAEKKGTTVFDDIDKQKLGQQDVGPAISSHLAEVAYKYWTDESKKGQVVSNIIEGLIVPENCQNIRVPLLNEAVARNRRVMPYHKRTDRRLADCQKSIVHATIAVLKMADELMHADNESRSPDLRKIMGNTVDAVTLLAKSHRQMSGERKERFRPVLSEDIRGICDIDTTNSEYLFGENLTEIMKEVKDNFRMSKSIVNDTVSKSYPKKHYPRTGSKRSFENMNDTRVSSSSFSLNSQGRKRNHQRRSSNKHPKKFRSKY